MFRISRLATWGGLQALLVLLAARLPTTTSASTHCNARLQRFFTAALDRNADGAWSAILVVACSEGRPVLTPAVPSVH
jgi:hypothetical protein